MQSKGVNLARFCGLRGVRLLRFALASRGNLFDIKSFIA